VQWGPCVQRPTVYLRRVLNMKRKHDDAAAPTRALTLPEEHAFSCELAESASSVVTDRTILSCKRTSRGVVEVMIKAGSLSGYGAREWPLRIGGVGHGDDPEIAAAIHSTPRGPVAVRFAVPIAMSGVDDTGCVDASFFVGLGERPTLKAICERASEWLSGAHLLRGGDNDDADKPSEEQRREWREAEAHCHGKLTVVDTYRRLALCKELVRDDARLLNEWVVPALHGLLECTADGASRSACVRALLASGAICECVAGSGIFAFDLFTPAFCRLVASECDHFEATDLPRRRPNTMNNQGLVINEIGMLPLMDDLLRRLIAPLSVVLYHREAFGSSVDHHHSFVVRYDAEVTGSDRGLDMHHDASEVTLNVCLGRNFEGAGLRFCGRFGDPHHRRSQFICRHTTGRAVMHLGRQRHGADEIASGHRINLIVWARSSTFRSAAAFGHIEPDGYPSRAEEGAPERECLSKSNDRDYERALRALDAGEWPPSSSSGGGDCSKGVCSIQKKAFP
jgi:hypothetical protein